eukprot:6177269-Pleurochrysis_carterae.AAC.7
MQATGSPQGHRHAHGRSRCIKFAQAATLSPILICHQLWADAVRNGANATKPVKLGSVARLSRPC